MSKAISPKAPDPSPPLGVTATAKKRGKDRVHKKASRPILQKVVVSPPAALTPTPNLQALLAAVGDNHADYKAVVVKNTGPAAYHLLKDVCAQHCQKPAWHCQISEDAKPAQLARRLAGLAKELAHLPADVDGIIQIFWRHEPESTVDPLSMLLGGGLGSDVAEGPSRGERSNAPENSPVDDTAADDDEPLPWEKQVRDAINMIGRIAPQVRIIVFTTHDNVGHRKALKHCEIFDCGALGAHADDMEKQGFSRRMQELHRRTQTTGDACAAVNALNKTAFSDLKRVYRHAAILARRCELPQPGIRHLREAAALLQAGWEPASPNDTVADTLEVITPGGWAAYNVKPTADLEAFTQRILSTDVLHQLDPKAESSLLLEGQPGAGKRTIVRALASTVGATLCAPKTSEVAALLVEKPGGFRDMLKNLNDYAVIKQNRTILYISSLNDIFTLCDELPRMAAFNVLEELTAALTGIGYHPDKDRVVLIAGANCIDKLPGSLRYKFSTEITLGKVSAQQLESLFLNALKGCKTSITGPQVTKSIVPRAAGFNAADVVASLHLAANIALRRLPSEAMDKIISEDDLIGGITTQQHRKDELRSVSHLYS